MRTNRQGLAGFGIAGSGSSFTHFDLKSAKAPKLNNITAHQSVFDLTEKEVYYLADLFAVYPGIVIQGVHNISFCESSCRHFY
jgi:hypothetical protein